ncbi:hypothetical protein EG832_02450, partial [bacterium]|nr:hypothetical protein [bacterium]
MGGGSVYAGMSVPVSILSPGSIYSGMSGSLCSGISGSLYSGTGGSVWSGLIKLRLITINHDLSNRNDESGSIILDPAKFVEIIPRMLKELFPEISDSDTRKISDFAMGFPLVAELLAKDRRAGSPNLSPLNDNQLVNRLIGVEDDEENEKKLILMACSIFEKFGYDEEYSVQRSAISRNQLITRLSCPEEIAVQKFYRHCEKFIEIGIIEKAGRYVFVKPKPLALRLAADWWNYCPPETIPSILA